MSLKRALTSMLITAGALLLVCACSAPALAQCAMCKAVVSGAANNTALAKGLNLAVLVLLIPPVTIFCSIFIVAIKYRKGREDETMNDERETMNNER